MFLYLEKVLFTRACWIYPEAFLHGWRTVDGLSLRLAVLDR